MLMVCDCSVSLFITDPVLDGPSRSNQENVCQRMFERLDCDAKVNSTEGFLGSIPILGWKDAKSLVGDSQFTYPIRELKEPRWLRARISVGESSSKI